MFPLRCVTKRHELFFDNVQKSLITLGFSWWALQGLNLRPLPCEATIRGIRRTPKLSVWWLRLGTCGRALKDDLRSQAHYELKRLFVVDLSRYPARLRLSARTVV